MVEGSRLGGSGPRLGVRVVALLDWPLLRWHRAPLLPAAFVPLVPVVRTQGGGRLGGGSGWQRRLGMVGLVGGG